MHGCPFLELDLSRELPAILGPTRRQVNAKPNQLRVWLEQHELALEVNF
jgi:hypothetical protein